MNHVVDPLVERLTEAVQQKHQGKFKITRNNIKSYLFVFVNCLIENPTFNSQTKEEMTTLKRDFGSSCELSEETIQKMADSGIID